MGVAQHGIIWRLQNDLSSIEDVSLLPACGIFNHRMFTKCLIGAKVDRVHPSRWGNHRLGTMRANKRNISRSLTTHSVTDISSTSVHEGLALKQEDDFCRPIKKEGGSPQME